jgi:hypothetical protein
MASYEVINDILLTLNNKLIGDEILSDLEEAFDCVNRDMLYQNCNFTDL